MDTKSFFQKVFSRFIVTITWIVAGSFLMTCKQGVDVTPQPPVITDQHMCSSACARLNALKCEEGDPIDMKKKCESLTDCAPGQNCINHTCHVTCEDFCVDTENAGVWLDPGCVSKIDKCSQVNSCPGEKKKLLF